MYTQLDFDYLSELAQTNPEEFERIKAAEVEKVIQSASPRNRKRLRGIQFQVDAKRQVHSDSPMGTCIEISKMMHQSFENLRQHLNLYLDVNDPIGNATKNYEGLDSKEPSAKVLSFRSEA